MRFSPNDKAVFPIAPRQVRCVWMTAGLLSYQLCDKNFNCESCPLDRAMRMPFTKQSDTQEHRQQTETARVAPDDQEYLYSRNHCWILKLGANLLRVGIEPALASLLMFPREIVLPQRGEPLQRGQFNCWIIIDDDAFPLASPVTATTLRTNQILQTNPHIICTHPLKQGWIFETEFPSDELKAPFWMTKGESEKKYASDFSQFSRLLSSELGIDHVNAGKTLQDGGQILQGASKTVGTQKYLKLLFETFGHMSS